MKKYLFTGLVILLPIALTAMIIIFLLDFFTTPFAPMVAAFLKHLQVHYAFTFPSGVETVIARLLALILLCIFVLLLGIFARLFVIRYILQGAYTLLSRIPLIKTILNVSRDVFTAIFSQDGKKAFQKPVLMPFPSKPNYCFAFVAGEVPEECQRKVKEKLVPVFAPTAPHPISGFLFLIPENQIQDVVMTNEQAFKYLVSCGLILPEDE